MLQIDSCRDMMKSRLTLPFRCRIQNPHLISLACLDLPPFLCSLSELIAALGPVPKALYKGSVVIVHWGLGCLKDYHLNKVPFIMVSPATKMMFACKTACWLHKLQETYSKILCAETIFPTVLKARLIAQEAEGITLLLNYMASYRKMLCTKSLCTTIIKPSASKNNYVYSIHGRTCK